MMSYNRGCVASDASDGLTISDGANTLRILGTTTTDLGVGAGFALSQNDFIV